jgi:hypothetical protein
LYETPVVAAGTAVGMVQPHTRSADAVAAATDAATAAKRNCFVIKNSNKFKGGQDREDRN